MSGYPVQLKSAIAKVFFFLISTGFAPIDYESADLSRWNDKRLWKVGHREAEVRLEVE